jgi:hypothetical protein
MPLAPHGAGHAKGDLMIEVAIVTDLGGLPDHHSHAMIDHESATEFRSWVDFYTG